MIGGAFACAERLCAAGSRLDFPRVGTIVRVGTRGRFKPGGQRKHDAGAMMSDRPGG
jgi:hypothetical protein